MEITRRRDADYWYVTARLLDRRVALTVAYYGCWRGFSLNAHENGGRRAHDCFDGAVAIGEVHVNLAIYGLGALARVTRHIPAGPRGRGYTIGWFARGCE